MNFNNRQNEEVKGIFQEIKIKMSSSNKIKKEIDLLKNRNNQYCETKLVLYEYVTSNNLSQRHVENIKTKTAGSEVGFIEENNFVKMTKKNDRKNMNNDLYNTSTTNERLVNSIKSINSLFPSILPKTEIQTINNFTFIKTEKAFTNCQDARIRNIQNKCGGIYSNYQQKTFKNNIGKGVIKLLLFGRLFGCKDIREDNIVFNNNTGEVKIVDYIPPAIDNSGSLNVSKTKNAFINLDKINNDQIFCNYMTNLLVNSQTIMARGFNNFTNINNNWINTLKKEGYINEQIILEAINEIQKEIDNAFIEIKRQKNKNLKEYEEQRQLLEFAGKNFMELAEYIEKHYGVVINKLNNIKPTIFIDVYEIEQNKKLNQNNNQKPIQNNQQYQKTIQNNQNNNSTSIQVKELIEKEKERERQEREQKLNNNQNMQLNLNSLNEQKNKILQERREIILNNDLNTLSNNIKLNEKKIKLFNLINKLNLLSDKLNSVVAEYIKTTYNKFDKNKKLCEKAEMLFIQTKEKIDRELIEMNNLKNEIKNESNNDKKYVEQNKNKYNNNKYNNNYINNNNYRY